LVSQFVIGEILFDGVAKVPAQVQLLEGVASVEVSFLRASGQGGTRMDGSLQSLRCQDPSHEEPALSCDAASGSVELAEKCHVTLRCPKMEVNTTESFLLRCKSLGWTLFFLMVSGREHAMFGVRKRILGAGRL
jgi:hypothetical protein